MRIRFVFTRPLEKKPRFGIAIHKVHWTPSGTYGYIIVFIWSRKFKSKNL